MHDDPKRAADRLVTSLEACDPVERSSLTTEALERALDELGAAIASRSRYARQSARRRSISRRTALLAAAGVVISGGIATGAVVSAHTGQFQPTQQEIAKASPEDAARMKSELAMGGPGEFLDPAAADFRDVALQIASDIPYPEGYESWRDFLVSDEIRNADGGTESSGALHGWFAASAFCAWVHAWRQAEIAGDTNAAAKAAQVISQAPGWKAVTDEDPHPDSSVPADQGSTYTLFGWMLPYRDAVLAGDRDRVENLLARGYGAKCWTSDPDWRAQLAAHLEWGRLSQNEMAQKYEQFLASRRS